MLLPILNYHGFEAAGQRAVWCEEELPYVVSMKDFKEQLAWIQKQQRETLKLESMKSWLEGKSVVQRPLMMTFDDGLLSHHDLAAPALKEKGMTGIFFVPAGLVGQKGTMSWSHLRDLIKDGFEIGSHGFNHVALTKLSETDLWNELETSKKVLEDHLGVTVKSLSVPRGYYQSRVRLMAECVNYRYVFTSAFDLNAPGADLLSLNRMVIKRETLIHEFEQLCVGNLGKRKMWEALKTQARQVVPPSWYDTLARVKRRLRQQESVSV